MKLRMRENQKRITQGDMCTRFVHDCKNVKSTKADLEVDKHGGHGAECQGQHGDSGAASTASARGCRCGGSGGCRGGFDFSRAGQDVWLVSIAQRGA